MNHIHRSLKHRWLLWLGYQFVEPKTLLVVYRDEQFHRLLEPGYHPPINTWRERYADEPISTNVRLASVKRIQVITHDRVKAKISLDVLFQFDPRQCPSQNMAMMVDQTDAQLEQLVTTICSKVARSICAAYAASEVASGLYRPQLEGRLTAHIHRQLQPFGISLIGTPPVSILDISLPIEIEQAWQKAIQRQIYASSLDNQTDEMNQVILQHELFTNSDSVKLQIKQTSPSPQSSQTVPLHKTTSNGHHKHHSSNQSVGLGGD